VELCFCLEEMVDGDEIRIQKCGHSTFHKKCLDKWLRIEGRCPLCRGLNRRKESYMIDE